MRPGRRAATGRPLPWPADPELVLKFIAHHLWDPEQKAVDPAHGMPDAVIEELWDRKILKVRGPHAPKTVSRRLANWSTLHQWKGVEPPFDHPGIRKALRLAMKASGRAPQRKSRKPVTRDVLDRLLATCSGSKAIDLRDRAILLVAFAAGGRRRSEVATLRHSQISAGRPDQTAARRSGISDGALCSHRSRPHEDHDGRAGRLCLRSGTRGCCPAGMDAGR